MDFEEVRRRIRAAESATRILRKYSWEPADFDNEKRFPNRDRFAARFKVLRLAEILNDSNLPQAKLDNLITRTIAAVDDLVRSEGANARRALEQLAKGGDCVAVLAAWWGGLDHDLKDALQYHIEGTLGLTSTASSANQILENCDRAERLFTVLNNDLRPLAGELKQLHDVLDADGSRNPFEYNCVLQFSRAWFDNIGEVPTLTRNTGARDDPCKTPFQRFVAEATAPRARATGPGILRIVVDYFREEQKRLLGI